MTNKHLTRIVWIALVAFRGSLQAGIGGSIASFPAPQKGKWGYIDRSGRTVIEPRFDYAWDFSDGLARVATDD